MKRRILAAALSAALILALAACGGGNKDNSSSNPGGGSSSGQVDGSTSGISQPDESGNTVSGPADGSQADGGGADTSDPSASGSSGGSASEPADITLTLNKTSIELNKAGATFQLNYKTDPEIDADPTFTSSDTKVAAVDNSGKITAVATGKATITVKCGGATATANVNCSWTEEANKPDTSKPADTKPSGGDTSKPADGDTPAPAEPPASTPANVDLSAFYSAITGKYEFAALDLADDEILNMFYEGMSAVSTEQRLIYVCSMTMNNGEFGLVQVKDSKDVDTVKSIFQARIDAQANGGAWYPQAVDSWMNNARVVSNGSYVMMVVHENCDDIVNEFNALF